MRAFATILVTVLASAACHGPTQPTSRVVEVGPTVTVVRLAIAGPAELPPGSAGQFTATAEYSDGTRRDVTRHPDLVWTTSAPDVLAISGSGLASALSIGASTVAAAFARQTAVKASVYVLPAGTYVVAGTVTDNRVPLTDVRVEVVTGSTAGKAVTASPSYTLLGVSGDVELLFRRDGYEDSRRRLVVEAHQNLNVELVPVASRQRVDGPLRIRITAASDCIDLSPEARDRTFYGALTQDGSRISAVLDGRFLTDGGRTYNSFSGTLAGDQLSFYIDGGHYYEWPDVAVFLTPPRFYFMSGTVVTRFRSGRRIGRLSGRIGIGAYDVFRFIVAESCESDGHWFELEHLNPSPWDYLQDRSR